jgi:hypothetical protein
LGALPAGAGAELKELELEASKTVEMDKTADIDMRVAEKATRSAEALVELFCRFFIELFLCLNPF